MIVEQYGTKRNWSPGPFNYHEEIFVRSAVRLHWQLMLTFEGHWTCQPFKGPFVEKIEPLFDVSRHFMA
jgi:hypothetical protein